MVFEKSFLLIKHAKYNNSSRVGERMRVRARTLTVVLAEAAAIGQVHIMSSGQVVSLTSGESCASLNPSGTSVESLGLRVGSGCSEASERALRLESLSAGVGS